MQRPSRLFISPLLFQTRQRRSAPAPWSGSTEYSTSSHWCPPHSTGRPQLLFLFFSFSLFLFPSLAANNVANSPLELCLSLFSPPRPHFPLHAKLGLCVCCPVSAVLVVVTLRTHPNKGLILEERVTLRFIYEFEWILESNMRLMLRYELDIS